MVMMQIYKFLIFIGFVLISQSLLAVTVVECEDADGNRTFQDRCPPGSTEVASKRIATGTGGGGEGGPAIGPLTLYVVPNCDSCTQVKEFLSVRRLSVTEKNVNDDIALQNELKEKAGDLRVPTLLVGDSVISGYNRAELLAALKKAGFQEEEEAAPNSD